MSSSKVTRTPKQANSLTTEVVWRVTVLSVIAIGGVLFVMLTGLLIALLQNYQQLDDRAIYLAQELDMALTAIENDLNGLGMSLQYNDATDDLLRDYLQRHPKVFSVALVDVSGEVLNQRQRMGGTPPASFAQQPWLAADDTYWGNVMIENGFPMVRVAAPVVQNNGVIQAERTASLVAAIDLTSFWEEIRTAQVNQPGQAYLVSEAGKVLVHRDLSLVNQMIYVDEATGKNVDDLTRPDNSLTHHIHTGLLGGWVVSATDTMQTTPWFIMAENPFTSILIALIVPGLAAVTVAGVVVWLIMSITTFMRQRIAHPLGLLRNRVDKFREGDMSQRIHLSRHMGDEIDLLAHTFNDMADSIEHRTRELLVANARAEEGSKLKTEFLSTISHELRTPLNAIMGYCGILLEGLNGEMDDSARRMVQRVEMNSHRLLNLINELLDLSQLETGQMDITYHPFDPKFLAANWENEYRHLIESADLTFVVQVDDNLPATLYGNSQRISQMVSNLLSNALKFTETGTITLRVSYHTAEWSIAVEDTGIGIPPKALKFIFDKFRQVDGTTTRLYGGTGLGLTIVQQLSRMMGGRVSIESEVSVGSTFTLFLPVVTRPGDIPHATKLTRSIQNE